MEGFKRDGRQCHTRFLAETWFADGTLLEDFVERKKLIVLHPRRMVSSAMRDVQC
jgi:hypothetical protein